MERSRNIGGRIEHAEFVMSIPASALLLLFRYPPRPFRHLASPFLTLPHLHIRRACTRFRRDYVSATSPRSKGGRWWWWLGGSDGSDPITSDRARDRWFRIRLLRFESRRAISFSLLEQEKLVLYFRINFRKVFLIVRFLFSSKFLLPGKKSFFFFTTFGKRTVTFNTSKLKKKWLE